MRKPISKELRKQVYDKYNGHCAYCGKEITLKEMQVDHATAYAQSIYGTKESRDRVGKMIADNSINSIDNLMPACRQCNFYKGGWDIENLRNRIKDTLEHTCRNSFQVRLAMRYGILTYKEWDGKFYFEQVEETIPKPDAEKNKVSIDGDFKVGDKVLITCKKQRDANYIYDGKIGEVINIWDLERNPWGNIGVRLPNGCNNGFLAEELEVVNKH